MGYWRSVSYGKVALIALLGDHKRFLVRTWTTFCISRASAHLSFFRRESGTHVHPHWNINGRLETRTVALQAATTELLVAGLDQWVRFVWNRWQKRYLMCAWPITYEARENFFRSSCRYNSAARKDGVIVIESAWQLCWIILLWWFISVMMMINLHGVRCVRKLLSDNLCLHIFHCAQLRIGCVEWWLCLHAVSDSDTWNRHGSATGRNIANLLIRKTKRSHAHDCFLDYNL